MDTTLLLGEYLVWHYGKSIRDYFSVWGNLLWFGYHFFSIELLLRTLVTPYRRFHQQYDWVNLQLQTLGQDILLNLFMRALGMALRLIVLVAGLVFESIILAAGAVFFACWLLVPILIPCMALAGLWLFFG